MSSFQERRQYPRAIVNWPVTIEATGGPMDGETKNISPGGVYVRCEDPPSKNETFSMTILPPDHSPLKVSAEVVWIDTYISSDDMTIPIGMGARFIEISNEDRQFLLDLVFDLNNLDDPEN